ncbi:hypothetical protein BJ508DRAFT_375709 [Ascobolus immersus RN42]|uniref:Ankyrin n=1 Tax=Ascobolus immersus RN42 TaxID=1160509 RepID=A0A3N4ILF9_ASCIM|nr:hypothetical protein BJ508DRAFT_375709 [Ascobolus immersus RN42]
MFDRFVDRIGRARRRVRLVREAHRSGLLPVSLHQFSAAYASPSAAEAPATQPREFEVENLYAPKPDVVHVEVQQTQNHPSPTLTTELQSTLCEEKKVWKEDSEQENAINSSKSPVLPKPDLGEALTVEKVFPANHKHTKALFEPLLEEPSEALKPLLEPVEYVEYAAQVPSLEAQTVEGSKELFEPLPCQPAPYLKPLLEPVAEDNQVQVAIDPLLNPAKPEDDESHLIEADIAEILLEMIEEEKQLALASAPKQANGSYHDFYEDLCPFHQLLATQADDDYLPAKLANFLFGFFHHPATVSCFCHILYLLCISDYVPQPAICLNSAYIPFNYRLAFRFNQLRDIVLSTHELPSVLISLRGPQVSLIRVGQRQENKFLAFQQFFRALRDLLRRMNLATVPILDLNIQTVARMRDAVLLYSAAWKLVHRHLQVARASARVASAASKEYEKEVRHLLRLPVRALFKERQVDLFKESDTGIKALFKEEKVDFFANENTGLRVLFEEKKVDFFGNQHTGSDIKTLFKKNDCDFFSSRTQHNQHTGIQALFKDRASVDDFFENGLTGNEIKALFVKNDVDFFATEASGIRELFDPVTDQLPCTSFFHTFARTGIWSSEINARDSHGYTVLHYAILNRNVGLFNFLITSKGCDVGIFPSWFTDCTDSNPSRGMLVPSDAQTLRELLALRGRSIYWSLDDEKLVALLNVQTVLGVEGYFRECYEETAEAGPIRAMARSVAGAVGIEHVLLSIVVELVVFCGGYLGLVLALR